MRPPLGIALTVFCLAAPALACPTCTCGNPALTTVGAEPLFQNRVRIASSLRAWAQDDGTAGLDAQTVRELRLDVTASWAFHRRAALTVSVPLQARELSTVSLAKERGFGLGEIEVNTRFVALADDARLAKYLVSVVAGARLPTALTLNDQSGAPLSLDAQLGYGAFVPLAGLTFASYLSDRWSLLASTLADVPLTGRFGARGGPGVTVFAAGQFQPRHWLGLRAGLEGRGEGVGLVNGEPDTARSGLLLQAAPDVLWSPSSSVVVMAGARVPFVNALGGARPSPSFHLSAVVDL
jgi:hypothetical protein